MSKKAGFPVMSPMITGVLFIVGVLLITLRTFAAVIITDAATVLELNGLLGFLAVFIMLWALVSLSLHPAIEANMKILFFAAALFIVMSVMATTFNTTVNVGKLV